MDCIYNLTKCSARSVGSATLGNNNRATDQLTTQPTNGHEGPMIENNCLIKNKCK